MQMRERKKIADYTKRIDLNPYDAIAYHERARTWIKLQEYQEAIDDCNRVIQLKKDSAKLHYHKGLAYIGLKNYAAAIASLSRAIELNCRYAGAYNNRGQAYAILQKYDKAIADFNAAIKIRPEYALAYRNRATIYHVRGDYESALIDYEKTLSLNTNDKLASFNRSTIIRILDKQGRTRRSLSQASTVLERDEAIHSNDRVSWRNLGVVLGSLIFVFLFVKLVTYSRNPATAERTDSSATKAEIRDERKNKSENSNLNLVKNLEIAATNSPINPTEAKLMSFKGVDEDIPRGMFNYGGSTVWAPIRAEVDKQIKAEIPQFHLRYLQHPIWNPSSSVGIEMLIDDRLSIAQSSRPLTVAEKRTAKENGYQLRQIAIAIDGIAIAVHPDLEVPGLSVGQLRDIYSGKITNWKEVGGPDLAIIPYSKSPHASGTANYFTRNILNEKHITSNVKLATSTTEGLRIVNSNKGAIFYASAAEIVPQCSVQALPIGYNEDKLISPYQADPSSNLDCQATPHRVNHQSFRDASYPLTNKLYVIVKQNGQIEEEAGFAYARLLLSEAGQQAIEKAGFVAIR